MNQTTRHVTGTLKTAVTLAELLQRLEASAQGFDAGQYRLVALQLTQLLAELEPGAGLEALLDAFPSAAVLYENLHYVQAGLCRSPLESSLNSELLAHSALQHARQPAKPTPL
jgi:hypothetical protein